MKQKKLKIYKNTLTLNGFDEGLNFTDSMQDADIALLGSKTIEINNFPKLKGIFRAGVGRDNVPEAKAKQRGIIVSYPSQETLDIIFNETASFTCHLILRMLYSDVGEINTWFKMPRKQLLNKNLLIIGNGKIGSRVFNFMNQFLNVSTYDVMHNKSSDLKKMINNADCISLHIPNSKENRGFFNSKKLSLMKDSSILINTSRASIVDEESLYLELKNKRIRAAFDVFWEEPYNGRLKKFYPNNFFMTPHVASTCSEFIKGCRMDLDSLISSFEID